MRDLDVELERRCNCATIHPHPDVFSLDGDMFRDRRENFLAQNGEQIGLAPPVRGTRGSEAVLAPM
jgi:hypothetical protein